jgi:HemY protein
MLRHQTSGADWDGALKTLSGASDGRILDKRTARRLRAVLLAAKARDSELGDPDAARVAALEAHELAPDLVPAAVAAGRLLARQGDVRRATRVLEVTWKAGPHPDVAEAYLHVRTGDAASDRLKRAETLFRMRPQADEGRHAVARAAIDARDFSRARDVLRPILTERPTRKALILMSELEQAENGDSGRARGWLARAVHAPRDPAWTADGMVLEEWAPASPVSGRLDTVEWKIPLTELDAPQIAIDATELLPAPPVTNVEEQPEPSDEAADPLAAVTESEASRIIDAVESPLPASTAESPVGASAPESSSGPSSTGASPGISPRRPRRSPVAGGSREPPATMPSAPRQIEPEAPMPPPIPDDPGVGDDEDETVRRLRAL